MRLSTDGDGYETIRVGDSRIYHHRVLSFARGQLDSVFFSEDAREVHHCSGVRWVNNSDELAVLTPEEHRERDPGRARVMAPWDRRGESA